MSLARQSGEGGSRLKLHHVRSSGCPETRFIFAPQPQAPEAAVPAPMQGLSKGGRDGGRSRSGCWCRSGRGSRVSGEVGGVLGGALRVAWDRSGAGACSAAGCNGIGDGLCLSGNSLDDRRLDARGLRRHGGGDGRGNFGSTVRHDDRDGRGNLGSTVRHNDRNGCGHLRCRAWRDRSNGGRDLGRYRLRRGRGNRRSRG